MLRDEKKVVFFSQLLQFYVHEMLFLFKIYMNDVEIMRNRWWNRWCQNEFFATLNSNSNFLDFFKISFDIYE